MHPRLVQEKLLRYCHETGVAVTAFSPLGAPSYVPLGMAKESESLLAHPAIVEIARAMNRTPAQVLLRWGVQRGTAVIPKTSRPERLVENLSVFDFALSAEAMAAISSLNENRRYNDPGVFCEQAFGTFLPIYE
jgi:D-xylose reductase